MAYLGRSATEGAATTFEGNRYCRSRRAISTHTMIRRRNARRREGNTHPRCEREYAFRLVVHRAWAVAEQRRCSQREGAVWLDRS